VVGLGRFFIYKYASVFDKLLQKHPGKILGQIFHQELIQPFPLILGNYREMVRLFFHCFLFMMNTVMAEANMTALMICDIVRPRNILGLSPLKNSTINLFAEYNKK
jgi:hypothetical protein